MAEPHAGIIQAKSLGNLRRIAGKPEHIFLRIVVHLAIRLHVVVQFDDASFGLRQHVAEFVQRPGEIVAVIVERNIGILAGVKSAVGLIGQNFIDPADDAFGGFSQNGVLGNLPAVDIILQQLRIVVAHFFEVRNQPALIDGIAVEAASQLVVNAAFGHFFEGAFGHSQKMLFAGLTVALEQ